MDDGIFEDFLIVKKILISHGHKSVDENLIFNLLEVLKEKDRVVKVLLQKMSSPADSSSESEDYNHLLKKEYQISHIDDFSNCSSSYHNGYSSDELKIVEYKVDSKTHLLNDSIDLTIDDNQPSSDVQNNEELEIQESVAADNSQQIINCTKKNQTNMELKENDQSENTEDAYVLNSTSETESEMDDYYRTPYIESEESEGFDAYDGKISTHLSLIINLEHENQNNDVTVVEQSENRMEEMLEENNNDPNNNLEDIEILEQNNGPTSTVPDNLINSNKITIDEGCNSPKPGCSKDSYYFCSSDELQMSNSFSTNKSFVKQDLEATSGSNQTSTSPIDKSTEILKNQDLPADNSSSVLGERLSIDVRLIKIVLPHLKEATILSHLVKNQDATNRLELALWDLLPDERPMPILSTKRKIDTDNCPLPNKKILTDVTQDLREKDQICRETITSASSEHIPQATSSVTTISESNDINQVLNSTAASVSPKVSSPRVMDVELIREFINEIRIENKKITDALKSPVVHKKKKTVKTKTVESGNLAPPKEFFNPLINMFPDVDPNYISELCISAKLSNQTLESIVEILLVQGINHPRIVNLELEPQDINPDIQYENLQGIFPDAHPEYLRNIAECYYNDPEAMKDFVQNNLETPNYPKLASYLKEIKITEQTLQYTVDFSVERFLQIFPDPFAHFENSKRVYKHNFIAIEFLKSQFQNNKIFTILQAYKSPKHPFHITLAARQLEIIGPDMKNRRLSKQLPTKDILLLQEFAFIQHKKELKDYIEKQKQNEKKEFERLKKTNQLIECQCCYDTECMPSKCSTCSEGHIFCNACVKLGSASKIGDGQTHFSCFVECEGEFTLPVLQKVLEPTTFSILIRKRQEEEVKAAGLDGLVSCPFCHFASIPPPEDKVFKCLNPECMKESCRFCKELNHVPLRCDEVSKGEEARRYLEEKMTAALVRQCYKCSKPFFKEEGCNKMTCPCGASTCYICGEPVTDYKHFNGQGSSRTDLCPLWSDDKVLNAQAVRFVAEATKKQILKKNPQLKINAEGLLPAMPKASKGPHEHIANGHILPVHARRL